MIKKDTRILVVDNEIDICNFVKMFFETRGYGVMTALNGDEAMRQLTTEKPNVVILDVSMRTDDEGLKYLPQIKELYPELKVIMVTGMDDLDTVTKARALGADDYITKPLMLEYLESTVIGKIRSLNI